MNDINNNMNHSESLNGTGGCRGQSPLQDMALKVMATIKEWANLVEINKDLPNEFSKNRHDIRAEAIKNMENCIDILKKLTISANNILEKSAKIHEANNQQVSEWISPEKTLRPRNQ